MKRMIIMFVFVIVSAGLLYADNVDISLIDALERTYANSLEIKRADLNLQESKRKADSAWKDILPSIGVSAVENLSFPGEDSSNTLSLLLSASLTVRPEHFRNIDMAKASHRLSIEFFNQNLVSVHKNTVDAYIELQQIKDEVDIREKLLVSLKELYEENRSRYQQGFISESDYVSSRILYHKAKEELFTLKLQENNLKDDFKLQLGLSNNEDIVLTSSLQEILVFYQSLFSDELRENLIKSGLLETNMDLKVLLLQKEVVDQSISVKRAEVFGPQLGLSYETGPYRNFSEDSGPRYRNTMTLSVTIPIGNLLPGSQARDEIKQLEHDRKVLELEYQHQKRSVEKDSRKLFGALDSKCSALEVYRDLVDDCALNYKIALDSYNKGLIDFQSLKNTSGEHLECQLEYNRRLVEILKVYASLEMLGAVALNVEKTGE